MRNFTSNTIEAAVVKEADLEKVKKKNKPPYQYEDIIKKLEGLVPGEVVVISDITPRAIYLATASLRNEIIKRYPYEKRLSVKKISDTKCAAKLIELEFKSIY